ncbi:hypothetical protein [Sphingobacterium sp.]|uniref:hypothetical protein n=1 Tax=Sphingobacterium sp. TaxID=341027 RepID=UPI002FDB344B
MINIQMKGLIWFAILSMVANISSSNINTSAMRIYRFKFNTDYHQFYIEDGNDENKGSASSEEFWNEKAFNERLAIINKVIGVGVESFGNDIKGDITLLEGPSNNIDYDKYDHIVEGGIDIQSGELQLLDCPYHKIQLSIKVIPGKYRVRVYSSNLGSVKDPDIANETDNDYYHIEIWKNEEMERKVLKQYTRRDFGDIDRLSSE